jgi:hypothetical protein
VLSQGAKANVNGAKLESRIEALLISLGIDYVTQHRYDSIYKHRAKMDFYLPLYDIAIEAKNQEVAGSVAEKIPYVMANFEAHPAKSGILVFGGAFWKTRPGIVDWAKNYSCSKFIAVAFEEELESILKKNWDI